MPKKLKKESNVTPLIEKEERELDDSQETPENVKKLTPEEMLTIQVGDLKKIISELELRNVMLQQKVLVVQKTNDQLNQQIKQKEVELLEAEKQNIVSRIAGNRKKSKEFTDSLKSKYGIEEEKWGYHPDTGEILETKVDNDQHIQEE